MHRTWLRGRENVHKRYPIHVAGHNILMRLLIGAFAVRRSERENTVAILVLVIDEAGIGILPVIVSADLA